MLARRAAFGGFKLMQRQAWDLADLERGSMDLIVLNNSLHEIPPHVYPGLFSSLNALLQPHRGCICIVDMESLPDNSPESIAVNWTGAEVGCILRSGGFNPSITIHDKQTTVYQAHTHRVEGRVDEGRMADLIRERLLIKLDCAIACRRKIDAALVTGKDEFRKWLVTTGSIARYSEELVALSAFTAGAGRAESHPA